MVSSDLYDEVTKMYIMNTVIVTLTKPANNPGLSHKISVVPATLVSFWLCMRA